MTTMYERVEANCWREEAKQLGLKALKSFWEAPLSELAEQCNGAGAAGYGWIVPDTMYGLPITAAAYNHDWAYYKGRTKKDRLRADWCFLYNMIKTIKRNPSRFWGIDRFRRMRACSYYRAVKRFGWIAFYVNRKPNKAS